MATDHFLRPFGSRCADRGRAAYVHVGWSYTNAHAHSGRRPRIDTLFKSVEALKVRTDRSHRLRRPGPPIRHGHRRRADPRGERTPEARTAFSWTVKLHGRDLIGRPGAVHRCGEPRIFRTADY